MKKIITIIAVMFGVSFLAYAKMNSNHAASQASDTAKQVVMSHDADTHHANHNDDDMSDHAGDKGSDETMSEDNGNKANADDSDTDNQVTTPEHKASDGDDSDDQDDADDDGVGSDDDDMSSGSGDEDDDGMQAQ